MYNKIEKVKVDNMRDKIYIPPHKKWIQLTKVNSSESDALQYEVLTLEWKDEFNDKEYIENNFDLLFVEPKRVVYEQPIQEGDFNELN